MNKGKRARTAHRVLLLLLLFALCMTAVPTVFAAASEGSGEIRKTSLSIMENVDIVFWTDITESQADRQGTYMTFNDGTPVRFESMRSESGQTYACFRYTGVTPQNLGHAVTAKMYVDGVQTDTRTYSVKDYCITVLADENASAGLKTLVSDLLVYGAKAQIYVQPDIADTELVTAGVAGLCPGNIPSEFSVLVPFSKKNDLTYAPTAEITGAGLLLESSTDVYFEFTAEDCEGLFVKTRIGSRESTLTPVRLSATDGTATYRAVLSDVRIGEMFDEISAAVYKTKDGNTQKISEVVSYSVAQYLHACKSEKDAGTELKDLVSAIYRYGLSAHLYTDNHRVSLPGAMRDVTSTSGKDKYAKTDMSCAVCKEVIETLDTVAYRGFSSGDIGSFSNESKYAAITKNGYLSILRNETELTQNANMGYYITEAGFSSAAGAAMKNMGTYRAFDSTSFTFSYKIKAPEAGLIATSLVLMNSKGAWASGNRGLTVLSTGTDGSITHDTFCVAPAGTVNPDTWTSITVTMEFADIYGTPSLYAEYYVNDVFVGEEYFGNTLLDGAVNQIQFASAFTPTTATGAGILYDDIAFSYGAAHSYNTSVGERVRYREELEALDIRDKILCDFDTTDFATCITGADGSTTVLDGITDMSTTLYPAPISNPTEGQHPRLLFTSSDIPGILAAMESAENAQALAQFLTKVKTKTDGKLSSTEGKTPRADGLYNYNDAILGTIEAKALYYALYKNDAVKSREAALRGYQAIYAIKNYMLTLDVQWKATDQCRFYGHTLYVAALVYDWCYDLLTDVDKYQLTIGAEAKLCRGYSGDAAKSTNNGLKMEVSFPPQTRKETPISGHGAEFQVLRDYLSFAIAVYDEVPSWWTYTGGLFYKDYVEARDYFYSAGYFPDGSACYNHYRYLADLWSAWLITGMGAENPYHAEDMQSVIYGMMSVETYNRAAFGTGDGGGMSVDGMKYCALISSYLFDDGVARALAKRSMSEFRSFGYSSAAVTPAEFFILSSKGTETAADPLENLASITYVGGFAEQIVARNGKGENSVVVLMQGAQKVAGGHTHMSGGNFQIYYKGFLSTDDGVYDSYGSEHHYYYHRATTAHNGILVFNPSKKSTNKGWYDGGQRQSVINVPYDFSEWYANKQNEQGYTEGVQFGYYGEGTANPKYIYFASNLTNAYDSDTVTAYSRSFMTLYTNNTTVPMVMFVFDNVEAVSADFQKTFTLQAVRYTDAEGNVVEPVIDGRYVTITNGLGNLVLNNLTGGTINKYGLTTTDSDGGSQRFWISGQNKNLPSLGGLSSSSSVDRKGNWGHIEIQPATGNKKDLMLNVLYVTDAGNTEKVPATLLEGTTYIGASFLDQTVLFISDENHTSTGFTFDSASLGAGYETMTYYVGGLKEGTWYVSINGGAETAYTVTEEGHLLTFEGAKGNIRIREGEDVRPANSGRLLYETDGGTLPAGYPLFFLRGEETALPVPTRQGYIFAGWYTDAALTSPISAVSATETENEITLYARWIVAPLDADYTTGVKSPSLGYYTKSGYRTDYTIMQDENGQYYLLWYSETGDPQIVKTGAFASYFAAETYAVSYEISFGRDGDNPLMENYIYLRDLVDGAKTDMTFLYTDTSGNVYIGNRNAKVLIGTLPAEGMYTVRLVLDFRQAKILAFDENGGLLQSLEMSAVRALPNKYDSYEEWFSSFSATGNYMLSWHCNGAGYLRISSALIAEGNIFAACRDEDTSGAHTWGSGVQMSSPSQTDCTPGIMKYTCTHCGAVKTELIAADGMHDLAASLVYDSGKRQTVFTCRTCATHFVIRNTSAPVDYNGNSSLLEASSARETAWETELRTDASGNTYAVGLQKEIFVNGQNGTSYYYRGAFTASGGGAFANLDHIVMAFDLSAPEGGLPESVPLHVKSAAGKWPGSILYVNRDGSVSAVNKTAIAAAGTIGYGKWTNVMIDLDMTTGKVIYYVNGKQVYETVYAAYASAGRLVYAHFSLSGAKTEADFGKGICIDNSVYGTSLAFLP